MSTIRTIFNPTINFTIKERAARVVDWTLHKIVKRLPRSVINAALIRAGARYSVQVNPNVIVPEMKFMDVLDGWDKLKEDDTKCKTRN